MRRDPPSTPDGVRAVTLINFAGPLRDVAVADALELSDGVALTLLGELVSEGYILFNPDESAYVATGVWSPDDQ